MVKAKQKRFNFPKDKNFTKEHSNLVRSHEYDKLNLPENIRQHSALIPTNLAHSNLFLTSTHKNWMMGDFPIASRWMSNDYLLSYTGMGLDSYDLEVMLNISKEMEDRDKLNPVYFNDYIDGFLEKDEDYQNLTPAKKEQYKKRVCEEQQHTEGFFLDLREFSQKGGFGVGGKTYEKLRNSFKKLSTGTLTVETMFKDDERENFVTSDNLIYSIYMPKREGYFITASPLVMNFFQSKTSVINTRIVENLNIAAKKSKKHLDLGLFAMLMTYAREEIWEVYLDDFLIKSPFYLLKMRDQGVEPFNRGTLTFSGKENKIKDMNINERTLSSYISRARKDIKEFFAHLSELEILTYQFVGRGDNAKVQFKLNRNLEKRAVQQLTIKEFEKNREFDF